jgi:hypothetical protein
MTSRRRRNKGRAKDSDDDDGGASDWTGTLAPSQHLYTAPNLFSSPEQEKRIDEKIKSQVERVYSWCEAAS